MAASLLSRTCSDTYSAAKFSTIARSIQVLCEPIRTHVQIRYYAQLSSGLWRFHTFGAFEEPPGM